MSNKGNSGKGNGKGNTEQKPVKVDLSHKQAKAVKARITTILNNMVSKMSTRLDLDLETNGDKLGDAVVSVLKKLGMAGIGTWTEDNSENPGLHSHYFWAHIPYQGNSERAKNARTKKADKKTPMWDDVFQELFNVAAPIVKAKAPAVDYHALVSADEDVRTAAELLAEWSAEKGARIVIGDGLAVIGKGEKKAVVSATELHSVDDGTRILRAKEIVKKLRNGKPLRDAQVAWLKADAELRSMILDQATAEQFQLPEVTGVDFTA